jgi:hypothetical protein
MKKIINLSVIIFILIMFFSCGNDDSTSTSYLIMEMELVNVSQRDTTFYDFSYVDGQLKQAQVNGQGLNKTYTAQFDGNGKITDAGNKRYEWDGSQLVKIIDDNGIWTDMTYNGDKLMMGEYFDYDSNNDIRKRGSYAVTDNGQNLSNIDNANASDEVIARHTFAGFDNKKNLFNPIWWFQYIGDNLGALRSGALPDAFFMENNPGSYTYELPQQAFERTINFTYTYDDQGRVELVEYEVGGNSYELIISY